MKEKMRVLVVPTWYPSSEDALMGIYHKRFCEALSVRDDIEVNILHIQRMRLSKPFRFLFTKKKEIEQNDGYKTYIYRMLNLAPISYDWQRRRYTRKLAAAYADYIRHEPPPDLLHAHVVFPAGYSCLQLSKKIGVPVVLTEHGFFSTAMNDARRRKYAEETLRNVSCTAVSYHQRDEYLRFGVPCEVLWNVVNDKLFASIVHEPSPDGTFRLVTDCALRKGKNVDDIAAAMKILIERGDIEKIHLTIIGDGFLEKDYKRSVRDMEMDGYVDFVGRKSEAEMAEYFAKADAFVVSSDLENGCTAGCEALVAGMTIITTRCRGAEEYVDESTGELCEPENPASMAEAILRAYKRNGEYDKHKRAEYAARYTQKAVGDNTVAIYKKALDNHKR